MTGLIIDDPVKFSEVIASGRVVPGDILKLRAGTYTGAWTAIIGGTEAAPVTIQPYNNEAVVIDGGFTFGRDWLTVKDIEIKDSRTVRTPATITDGVTMNKRGCWLIGCHIHDLHSSGVNAFGPGPAGIVECVMQSNGYYDGADGHGHSIYAHNHQGGARTISRNLFSRNFGNYTIHIYSGGNNYLKDFIVEDNVSSGDVHTGGGFGLIDFAYRRNTQYENHTQMGRYITDPAYQNIRGAIEDNLFIEPSSYLVNYGDNAPLDLPWLDLTESGNLVWEGGVSWVSRDGYTVQAKPATWSNWIPYSLSGRWVGALALFDRDSFGSVTMNFTRKLEAGTYTLRNYQNMSETAVLDLTGSLTVSVPTAGWTAVQPIGTGTLTKSWPRFGALVIEKA